MGAMLSRTSSPSSLSSLSTIASPAESDPLCARAKHRSWNHSQQYTHHHHHHRLQGAQQQQQQQQQQQPQRGVGGGEVGTGHSIRLTLASLAAANDRTSPV